MKLSKKFIFASMALLIVMALLIASEVAAARELGQNSKPCNYNMIRGQARQLQSSNSAPEDFNYYYPNGRH